MPPTLNPKPSFDEFIHTCTPLLKIPELEVQMRDRVRSIVKELLNFQPNTDPAKNLRQFIQKDKSFLGVLLALTNLSQEKNFKASHSATFRSQGLWSRMGCGQDFSKI